MANQQTQISVRDCGTGIPPALIERLFEPFVTTKPEGLGLGLSISRTIVAAHGGRLWAENNIDGGATLHCLLGSTSVGAAEPVRAPARLLRRAFVVAKPAPASTLGEA
jgi:two-component system sensor kinase FixL